MAIKHLTAAALALAATNAFALDLKPYVEAAIGPAYVYGEVKGDCWRTGGGAQCKWDVNRDLRLGGRAAAGVEAGVIYIEAEHTSVIGEKDAGADAVWLGVRWRWE